MMYDYGNPRSNGDSEDDAQERATFHRNRDDTGVFIAEIDISQFATHRLRIQFLNELIELEGIIGPLTSTTMFPMTDLGNKFRIDYRIVQNTEWLALESISPELIQITDF